MTRRTPLRQRIPQPIRDAGRSAAVGFGQATTSRRLLPDFLVIGAQRCGTTSLFRALMSHPQVRRPTVHKGVNYFDLGYERGERWYRAHFPARSPHDGTLAFDSSGYYLFHPLAAGRIVRDLPAVRVIALVRDPVERAFSAYKHEHARGFEPARTFAEALDLEEGRLDGEIERMVREPGYQSFSHRHHAYRARGEYAFQLAPYLLGLGSDRVLVVESERFFSRPEEEYGRIRDFLGLAAHTPERFDRWNARPGSDLPEDVRARLSAHFAPHDEHLAGVLGRAPVWRSGER